MPCKLLDSESKLAFTVLKVAPDWTSALTVNTRVVFAGTIYVIGEDDVPNGQVTWLVMSNVQSPLLAVLAAVLIVVPTWLPASSTIWMFLRSLLKLPATLQLEPPVLMKRTCMNCTFTGSPAA